MSDIFIVINGDHMIMAATTTKRKAFNIVNLGEKLLKEYWLVEDIKIGKLPRCLIEAKRKGMRK